MLSDQFKEHMALRRAVGREIAENRRIYPVPDWLKSDPAYAGSQGQPGMMHDFPTLEGKNQWLKEKLASTKVSNAIGRGEMEPTEERFG